MGGHWKDVVFLLPREMGSQRRILNGMIDLASTVSPSFSCSLTQEGSLHFTGLNISSNKIDDKENYLPYFI